MYFFQLDPDRSLFDQSIELPYDPEWEFPRERITIMRQIGSGAFGIVSLATARGVYALSPRDKDAAAIRRRAQLRLHKRIPKSLLSCFFNDDLCEQNIFVAVKSLKGLSFCLILLCYRFIFPNWKLFSQHLKLNLSRLQCYDENGKERFL